MNAAIVVNLNSLENEPNVVTMYSLAVIVPGGTRCRIRARYSRKTMTKMARKGRKLSPVRPYVTVIQVTRPNESVRHIMVAGVRRSSSHGRSSCSLDIVNGGGLAVSQLAGVQGVGSCKARLSEASDCNGSWTVSGEGWEDKVEIKKSPLSPESKGKARAVIGSVAGGEIGT